MLLVVTAPSLGQRVLILLFSICLSQTLSDQSDLSALSHLILTPPCLQCVCVWVSTSIMSWRPIIKVKRCCSVVQCHDLLSQVSISFFKKICQNNKLQSSLVCLTLRQCLNWGSVLQQSALKVWFSSFFFYQQIKFTVAKTMLPFKL